MIDEGSNPDYLTVFHSLYAFYWHSSIFQVISGNAPATYLREQWVENNKKLPKHGLFLRDMDNHDTVTDWKDRIENMAGHNGMELILALNYVIDGVPMVYCGNELADNAKLSMFANRFYMGKFEVTDRSVADRPYSIRRQNVIKKLNLMKKECDALSLGETVWLDNSAPEKIISFMRELDDKRIVFIGNLSDQGIEGRINDFPLNISEKLLESEEAVKLGENGYIIPPYGYMVVEK